MSAPTVPALPLAAVELYLKARGLALPESQGGYPDAEIVRGIGDAADIKRVGPGRGLILSRSAGPGLMAEWAFDRPIVTIRTIGRQSDYDDGETLAFAVDRWMLADSPVNVGGRRALFVQRAGGGPTLIQVDSARRSHFSSSYIIPVASGL